jgi:hypothetical protein
MAGFKLILMGLVGWGIKARKNTRPLHEAIDASSIRYPIHH